MATQRRKRTPKKAAPKRTIWRTLFWLGFKLSLVVAAFMVVFGIYLDTKVRERFDGEKWQLPVMVYSRPLELYPSQRLSQTQMLRELNMLSYKQVRQPHTPGEYAVSGNRIELVRRPFEFHDGADGARGLRLTFNGARLEGSSPWRTSVSSAMPRWTRCCSIASTPRIGKTACWCASPRCRTACW
jgi:penicillin-binding protein 1B